MKKFIKKTFLMLFCVGVIFLMYIMSTLPSIGGYTYTPTSKSVIISSDGYKLGEITSRDATYISADEIPVQRNLPRKNVTG